MITLVEHRERALALTRVLESEVVPLADACGRGLAAAVFAAIPVPPWTNSAMDGYAVRFDDVAAAREGSPVKLRVTADLPAGSGSNPEIGPGEAARIMTGAPVPDSTDTIVPVEMTDGGTDQVQINLFPERGRHIRHAGEDRAAGDLISAAGTELTPEAIAAIASAGVGEVKVSKRPRVAVVSTGDELITPGDPLTRGQIPDSNALLISFLARDAGAVSTVAHAGDKSGELAAVLERTVPDCDVLVMTGGVSVGAYDPVKELFAEDPSVRFDRVAMQPGKPQALGRLAGDGPLLFGLPGNPVSAWVSFQVFVRPALRKMQGLTHPLPEPVPARAAENWNTPMGRSQIIPVRIHDGSERRVLPAAAGGSGSHLIASLADADGYALIETEVERVQAGDLVDTVRLRDPEQFNHQQRSQL